MNNAFRELDSGLMRVSSGDFDTKIPFDNKLSVSFNYMTDRIKALFSELSTQKEELNSIISFMQSALMVMDQKGKIILANDNLKRILKNNSIKGKFYWEILREPQLNSLINLLSPKKENILREIKINEETFLCSAGFTSSGSEIVLILHNITEIKNLEKVKKDFIVNASHELRTPLTAIRGYLETITEEIEPKLKGYLSIALKHTMRLINIVEDLLKLSELEEEKIEPQWTNVSLKELIKDVTEIFERTLKEKGLTLKLLLDDDTPRINADAFKLQQMFINLIDNSIKYTKAGSIEIFVTHKDQQVKVQIKDTGIGIPSEHIPRIFERFYVVDKSHSKKSGGTGLGLSIVKHIVLMHNGNIDVESSLGTGTTFTITFPLTQS